MGGGAAGLAAAAVTAPPPAPDEGKLASPPSSASISSKGDIRGAPMPLARPSPPWLAPPAGAVPAPLLPGPPLAWEGVAVTLGAKCTRCAAAPFGRPRGGAASPTGDSVGGDGSVLGGSAALDAPFVLVRPMPNKLLRPRRRLAPRRASSSAGAPSRSPPSPHPPPPPLPPVPRTSCGCCATCGCGTSWCHSSDGLRRRRLDHKFAKLGARHSPAHSVGARKSRDCALPPSRRGRSKYRERP